MLTEHVTGEITDVFIHIILRSVPTRTRDSSTSKNPVINVYTITYREGTGGGVYAM